MNDVVSGVPVAVTYCPLCFTGIVFDRRVGGDVLEFGVSGKLVMNDLVMYDRQTESLWQQILGEGIRGRFKGVRLQVLPVSHTRWGRWLTAHPDTLVLDKGGRYSSDSYAGYYAGSDRGVTGGALSDPRLPGKALVLGVVGGGQPKAYPFDSLSTLRVANDKLGDLDLVIVFDDRSTTAVAFERTIAGRVLTFDVLAPVEGDLQLRDVETGSVWSGLTGQALEGPLAGGQLPQLPATYAFWFAWSDFYTQTEVYVAPVGASP